MITLQDIIEITVLGGKIPSDILIIHFFISVSLAKWGKSKECVVIISFLVVHLDWWTGMTRMLAVHTCGVVRARIVLSAIFHN